jgi:hypothetical protein
LEQYLLTGRFAIFVFGVLAASFYLSRLAKSQGSRNIYIYVTICNLLGSLGVLLSKGIGIVVQSERDNFTVLWVLPQRIVFVPF